jgi:hypothetical protein
LVFEIVDEVFQISFKVYNVDDISMPIKFRGLQDNLHTVVMSVQLILRPPVSSDKIM